MKRTGLRTPALVAERKASASRCVICHRSLILRQLTTGKTRIKMHGSCFCSSACFVSAAEAELTRLLALNNAQPEHIARMSLAHILISRGSLTNEQFRAALDDQKETGGEIGRVLTRLGFVSESQLTAVRALQWGCPVFPLTGQGNLSSVRIPAPLIRVYSMIPLHYTPARNLLLVGFVDSIEYGLLYLIERITGYKTEPCFISMADFQVRLNEWTMAQEQQGVANQDESASERSGTPAEMAQTLRDCAVEGELEEAVIGRFKDYLWARLKFRSKDVDFLFNAG